MKKYSLLVFITVLTLLFIMAGAAHAKRLGGGSSFGSKSSYSSPFKKSSTQKSPSQQKAAATNQAQKQQLSKRGGLMGMLGGLALGGLLGALFFGGAFENFNMFDLLIIGAIIFAIYWFMKRKKPAPAAAGQFSSVLGQSSVNPATTNNAGNTAGFDTDKMFKQSSDSGFNLSNNNDAEFTETDQNSPELPSWFDQDNFLEGARSAYTMMQKSWDEGDLENIRSFTTDSIYQEISSQYQNNPSQGATRVLQLNAELIDFASLSNQYEAAVLFDNLLAETDDSGNAGRATQVKEIWHFIRATDSNEPTWYLDGIQQVES